SLIANRVVDSPNDVRFGGREGAPINATAKLGNEGVDTSVDVTLAEARIVDAGKQGRDCLPNSRHQPIGELLGVVLDSFSHYAPYHVGVGRGREAVMDDCGREGALG